jgi:monoamine oxidase
MVRMDRRTFLQTSVAISALIPFGTQAAERRRVIVAGAGLAGLSAAYELDRAGFDVVILEARTRPGGRVYTLREPFSDGLYAEVGAARIQDSHEFTLRYAKQFGLTLDPFFPADGARVSMLGGKRFSGPVDFTTLPLGWTDEERKLGYRGCLGKYLFSHMGELGDVFAPDWPTRDVSRFEVTIPEFCRRQGASQGMLKTVAVGHDLGDMSALHLLRDAAVGASTKVWFKIRGGNDLLPKAFAAALADKIQYGAPITRIEQSNTGVRVTYRHLDAPVTVAGDYLVCTLPLTVLRKIEVTPALPALQRAAINEVAYLPMARVFLQSRRRFWLERGENGWAGTDDPIDVWDYTRDQPGTRGILGAYTSGRMAYAITAKSPEERIPFMLEMMERVHPGMKEQFEGGASHSWITDPWALGAGAGFHPGQLSKYASVLRKPEGRIYFAGEHTSAWSGWMNGGLESGNRVVQEIRKADG